MEIAKYMDTNIWINMCEDDLPIFNHKVEPGLGIPSEYMKVGLVIIFMSTIIYLQS
jgi:hypothetical protein